MRKDKVIYSFLVLTIIITIIGFVLPYYWKSISSSRQKAVEMIAASVEIELEQAMSNSNSNLENDLWLVSNSKCLALEPWGNSQTARPTYRFLDYLPPEACARLHSFDVKWLRQNVKVIYEGKGNFRVEILK